MGWRFGQVGWMRRHLAQRLKFHQLRAVESIGTHGSLLRASKALGISQPALTKTLQEMEDVLGVRLFQRQARGVVPTEFGGAVIQSARRLLAELGRLDEELDRLSSGAVGTVVLGALPVAAAGLLPGVLARLKARHPGLSVRLVQGRTEELLPALAAGDLDLIVGRLYAPDTPDGFVREALYDEPISILARAGHPIFDHETVTVEALRRFDLVLPTVSQRVGREIEGVMAALGIAHAASLRASSRSFTREMLHAADFITIAPRLMLAGDLLRGTIRVVPLPIPAAAPRPAGLIYRPDRGLPPAGHALVEALRDHLEELTRDCILPITSGYSSS